MPKSLHKMEGQNMKYDFDNVIDRRGTGSLKWDVPENELPMWVADMDFQTAPCIREALAAKVEHGIFGYSIIPDEWADAYVNWWGSRHGFQIDREWLVFCTGVIPAISTAVRKLTTPAENVVVQTPVYNIFFNSIYNNGRNILVSPLKYDGEGYTMDFEDLEAKLSDPQTSLMILCNPQNPAGKIWDKETLAHVGELCAKYGVTVISDEIHCDLTDPGKEYVPFATASNICRDISVTCIAPTKTFNIAGIQTAAIVVPNKFLRHKMWRGLNTDEVAEPNVFAVDAAIAAFTKGGEWLDSLRQYLYENKQYVRKFVSENIPDMKVVYSEATYLLWLDCSQITDNAKQLSALIRKNTGLYMSPGLSYGKNGKAFIRLNIACPRSTVEEGMKRLAEGVGAFKKSLGAEAVSSDDRCRHLAGGITGQTSEYSADKKGDIDE